MPHSKLPGALSTDREMQGLPQQDTLRVLLPPGLVRLQTIAQSTAGVPSLPARNKGIPNVSHDSAKTSKRMIAITFDDGPHAKNTPRLLEMLRMRKIKATFYVVGKLVAANPKIVRSTIAEGHEVGNHTWSHDKLTSMPAKRVHEELSKTHEAVHRVVDYTMKTMRPPYGATNPVVKQQCRDEFGYTTVLCDVDPLDWEKPGSEVVKNRILLNTKPGSIILAHDIHEQTIDAMPGALDGLLEKGYTFVTVSALLNLDAASPMPMRPL